MTSATTDNQNGSVSQAEVRPSSTHADEDETIYQVVVNHEEQYSIWPDYRGQPPAGWSCVGVSGSKAQCLAHINEVWTDMRPKSLRLKMQEPSIAEGSDEVTSDPDPRDDLVAFLCAGVHPLEASLRPDKTVDLLKAALGRDYVHLRFTDTRGGTELGVQLDRAACNFGEANFDDGTGVLHIEGTLELDDVSVRCVADLDLASMCGTGFLRRERGQVPAPA